MQTGLESPFDKVVRITLVGTDVALKLEWWRKLNILRDRIKCFNCNVKFKKTTSLCLPIRKF